MFSPTRRPHRRPAAAALLASAVATWLLLPSAQALDDAPPVDVRGMLQALTQLRDLQTTQAKALRSRAYQEAVSSAANPAKAAEQWEEAVRLTQFQGLPKDNAQFREWKSGDGEALKEKEIQTALHLYFNWLALTLQKSAGSTNKELYSAVYSHAREVMAEQTVMDNFVENLKREKEAIKDAKRPVSNHDKKEKTTDEAVKRLHDQLMNQALSGSVYAQAMKITEEISGVAPKKNRGGGGGNNGGGNDNGGGAWEGSPGNLDGIYTQILLPEMRLQKDPRVVEYWDMKLRREAEAATRNKLTAEIEKFNTQRRPQLLWSRAQEWANIGQKNRAATEMFAVIKAAPAGTDTTAWITELVAMIAPPAPAAATAPVSTADLPQIPPASGGTAAPAR